MNECGNFFFVFQILARRERMRVASAVRRAAPQLQQKRYFLGALKDIFVQVLCRANPSLCPCSAPPRPSVPPPPPQHRPPYPECVALRLNPENITRTPTPKLKHQTLSIPTRGVSG